MENPQENCVFCRILKKEISADFAYEDDAVAVFADIKPSAPVHYLVVPKRHVDSVMALDDTDGVLAGALILAAKKVAAAKGLKGYRLVFNVGREGGQVVDHLHLHLIGGWTKPEEGTVFEAEILRAP
ncbi:MAG: HIT domain-containing protein [Candidatus Brennerbacteria bacterium]|nr:HIT domain-containing protein [Candidatus Brennerbacteria bacterium]